MSLFPFVFVCPKCYKVLYGFPQTPCFTGEYYTTYLLVTLKRPEGDNPTVGILLGTEIDETDVKYSVMADCERLFATKLMPYMPSRDELKTEIERSRLRAAAQTARKRLLPAASSSKEKRS